MGCLGYCIFGRIFVPGKGPPSDILLLGEAPGYQENKAGQPFVGPAGKVLDRCLGAAGLDRCRISNVVHCVDLTREDRKPTPAEIEACSEFLWGEIRQCKIICALGGTALSVFMPGVSISRARGKLRAWPFEGKVIPVLATYHPAFALPGRSPEVAALIVEDFKLLKGLT